MPDITKCVNKECPLRNDCHRYTVQSSEYYQSYAKFKVNDDGSCDSFIKSKEATKK